MTRVICVGTAVIDTIFAVDRLPLAMGKNFAESVLQVGGGVAANPAVTVSALGGEGVLWSRLGADPIGDEIVRELVAWSVDVANVQRVPGLTSPISTVMIDRAGERQIINHLDPRLLATTDPLPLDDVGAADAVMCDVRWPIAAVPVLRAAKERGIPRVVDIEQVPEALADDFLELASHVVFSDEGLAQASGSGDLETGLRRMAGRTDAWLGVTCGARGCYWLTDTDMRHMPAFAVDVVDTLAAGDVFHGALALALAEHQPIEAAVRLGSAAAAIKCTRFGGRRGIPNRDDVERFLRERG